MEELDLKDNICVLLFDFLKQNLSNFPIFTAKTQAIIQDLYVTATRYHNVYTSLRPSIATKDTETCGKMNSVV